jgi:lactam utilization protein B
MMTTSTRNPSSDLSLVKTLLREHWDPLRVGNEPKTMDEYDSYAGKVLKFGQDDNVQGLKDYLTSIEVDQMGIHPDLNKNESVATMIVDRLKKSKVRRK